jgi:hypothetical protein
VWQDLGFGTARPTTFYDRAILTGWGTRPWNWEFSVGIQAGTAAAACRERRLFRRVQGNFNGRTTRRCRADFTQIQRGGADG